MLASEEHRKRPGSGGMAGVREGGPRPSTTLSRIVPARAPTSQIRTFVRHGPRMVFPAHAGSPELVSAIIVSGSR